MGYRLYREIKHHAPSDWKGYERLVALLIADDANDDTRISTLSLRNLLEETGYSERMVRFALARLSSRGFEFRISHGTMADGREMFAVRGHAVTYRVPPMPVGGNRVPPLPFNIPVDNPPVGGNGVPVNKEIGGNALPPNDRIGGNGVPDRRQPGAAPFPQPLIPGVTEVGAPAEVRSPMSPIERAALQASRSRRERQALIADPAPEGHDQ